MVLAVCRAGRAPNDVRQGAVRHLSAEVLWAGACSSSRGRVGELIRAGVSAGGCQHSLAQPTFLLVHAHALTHRLSAHGWTGAPKKDDRGSLRHECGLSCPKHNRATPSRFLTSPGLLAARNSLQDARRPWTQAYAPGCAAKLGACEVHVRGKIAGISTESHIVRRRFCGGAGLLDGCADEKPLFTIGQPCESAHSPRLDLSLFLSADQI